MLSVPGPNREPKVQTEPSVSAEPTLEERLGIIPDQAVPEVLSQDVFDIVEGNLPSFLRESIFKKEVLGVDELGHVVVSFELRNRESGEFYLPSQELYKNSPELLGAHESTEGLPRLATIAKNPIGDPSRVLETVKLNEPDESVAIVAKAETVGSYALSIHYRFRALDVPGSILETLVAPSEGTLPAHMPNEEVEDETALLAELKRGGRRGSSLDEIAVDWQDEVVPEVRRGPFSSAWVALEHQLKSYLEDRHGKIFSEDDQLTVRGLRRLDAGSNIVEVALEYEESAIDVAEPQVVKLVYEAHLVQGELAFKLLFEDSSVPLRRFQG